MKTRVFRCERNEDLDTVGWCPVWMPDADAYHGMAVAHDTLEHPAECRTGRVQDEFMAIGAMYWIRGETGWFTRGGNVHPAEVHLAADIPDILTRVADGVQTFYTDAPRLAYIHTPDRVATAFRTVLRHAKVDMADRERDWSLPLEERAIGWMMHGYCYTRRRYWFCDQYQLSCLFTNIAEKADSALRHAAEGDRLLVDVTLKNYRAHVRVHTPMREVQS